MARKLVLVGIIVAVVLGGGGIVYFTQDRDPELATAEVSQYLAAWERFDGGAMAAVVEGAPVGLSEAVTAMRDDLKVSTASFRTVLVERQEEEQRATYRAELEVGGVGRLTYDGTLRLVETPEKEWRIAWDHSALHPELRPDRRFQLAITWSTRAPIMGVGGTTLVSTADSVDIGLAPGRIQDLAQVQAILTEQLDTDPAAVAAALAGPGIRPEQFVAVARVPRDRFAAVRPVLEPIPGIFFQSGSGRAAPSDDFAVHLIGRVGEVTAERLAQLGPPYAEGAQVGLSGLEAAHERQLAGVPAAEVRLVDGSGATVATVAQLPGTPPEPLVLTLDRGVQEAAEQALAGVDKPAAIVAIDAPTGEVRAVAARPLDEAFNRAVHGRYPPGSSFKVVTAEGLVRGGLRPDTTVPCEPTASVGGKSFKNFEDEAFGTIPFRDAFAHSCNTAFVTLADGMSDGDLVDAAGRFGFGVAYDAGMGAEGGDFPEPNDAADRAASAIGQGRVLASPLHMASVAAAVASGAWRPPRVVASQPPEAEPVTLEAPTVAILADLMREVVRTGTGTSAAVPGQDVGGKTGTAEFGNADPLETHAWFIGFRGSLAFAVLVEDGGVGGQVAAPIAARFLTAAPGV
ncbi:MAG TPA: penicillin-binding transpeptidase domain-containing protein [Acidimicrobiales bacterium]|nr:penicillin-binding transpeptidase domain-containing protein [Acidimicrobiales bacterium]